MWGERTAEIEAARATDGNHERTTEGLLLPRQSPTASEQNTSRRYRCK